MIQIDEDLLSRALAFVAEASSHSDEASQTYAEISALLAKAAKTRETAKCGYQFRRPFEDTICYLTAGHSGQHVGRMTSMENGRTGAITEGRQG